jgi:hypothetical protein
LGITASGKTTLEAILTRRLVKTGINNLEFLDEDKLRACFVRIWSEMIKMATPSQQNGSYRPGKPLFDQRLNIKSRGFYL